ncbi:MAG: aminopeptidase P family protein [Rhodospirillales bacterium]|nr:aminopeptidase P family protein [Rhodospirillales bacterium]
MPLHFTPEELAARRKKAVAGMTARGLDGLLMFRQESMYYLTGYDGFGFVFFQVLYLGADGRLVLITRKPDEHVARYTSMIEDIRVWIDRPDADPAFTDVRPMLESFGCKGKRLGVEWDAYGLTAKNGRRLQSALETFCRLEDASDLVTLLRVVKSPPEIAHVRRASELADDALEEAWRLARPGVHVNDVLAAMQAIVFKGGGDYPGNEFIVGSGPAGKLGRYQSTRHVMTADDVLQVEHAGVYRHYHSCQFRTIKIGKQNPKHESMYRVSLESLAACKEAAKPGNTFGDVFAAYARVMEGRGFGNSRHNACGYGLGALFHPNWMDWPMFYRDNPVVIEPGMVLFFTGGVRDHADDLFAVAGETVLVTEKGHERLSRLSLDYVRNP